MRKLTLALIFLATSAFANTSPTVQPTTTNNDDSCDISVQPAATLLLPYFEVDADVSPLTPGATTLFTVQNVSNLPQIANVTIWTDWGYPLFDFSIFLTGYDVQPINLYDLLKNGIIAPGPSPAASGTSNLTPVPANPTLGSQPAGNSANPNFLASAAKNCATLPGSIPAVIREELTQILTTGTSNGLTNCPAGTAIGGSHKHAVGYVTIDVVATCYPGFPASTEYYNSVLLFDNVLTGDYQQITPGKYALGGPLVHIRAVPEGGPAGSTPGTNLPYTFYDRMTTNALYRDIDRRQPLPAQFAPRFVQGGAHGFNTSFKIWREAVTGANATCADYSKNSYMPVMDVVRFDEHENATVPSTLLIDPPPPLPGLPATSMVATDNFVFPPLGPSGDVAGWIYLNLNNGGSTAYSVAPGPGGMPRYFANRATTVRPSQNWVITSMYADPTYASEGTAVALSNGCSPAPLPDTQIGPAPNANP